PTRTPSAAPSEGPHACARARAADARTAGRDAVRRGALENRAAARRDCRTLDTAARAGCQGRAATGPATAEAAAASRAHAGADARTRTASAASPAAAATAAPAPAAG